MAYTSSTARVSGLYGVGLKVSDLEAATTFYKNCWGMAGIDNGGDDRRCFQSPGSDHPDLDLVRSDAAGIDHIALSVPDQDALNAILNNVELHKTGSIETTGTADCDAIVRDADGLEIHLHVASALPPRPGKRLGHIVLWTGDIEAQEEFYRQLGFEVSDRTHMGMSFLRCNRDHHSLALARSSDGRSGLQHVAFDIGTIDDVMREFARLRECGVECIWGVGRHGPGNNVFSYFEDPAGNVVENYGEMEVFDDASVGDIRFWGPEHKGDVWGIAGPPPKSFRG